MRSHIDVFDDGLLNCIFDPVTGADGTVGLFLLQKAVKTTIADRTDHFLQTAASAAQRVSLFAITLNRGASSPQDFVSLETRSLLIHHKVTRCSSGRSVLVTNIAMGTEINNIVEFEEVLDLPLDDLPTDAVARSRSKLLPA